MISEIINYRFCLGTDFTTLIVSPYRICTYQQEGSWEKAVMSCDIQMGQSGQANTFQLLQVRARQVSHDFN